MSILVRGTAWAPSVGSQSSFEPVLQVFWERKNQNKTNHNKHKKARFSLLICHHRNTEIGCGHRVNLLGHAPCEPRHWEPLEIPALRFQAGRFEAAPSPPLPPQPATLPLSSRAARPWGGHRARSKPFAAGNATADCNRLLSADTVLALRPDGSPRRGLRCRGAPSAARPDPQPCSLGQSRG